RAERFRPDADFQRGLRHPLSRGRASLAAAARLRRLCVSGYFNSGGGGTAPGRSGKIPFHSDAGSTRPACSARAHSAAVPPVAGWIRSAVTGSFLVEERL